MAPADTHVRGSILIAADGIHSVMRSIRYPAEGLPKWNGAMLWRGLAEAPPVLDGRTMVWAGHPEQKFVGYPIANLADGRQVFNFIAEFRMHGVKLTEREDWNQPGVLADFIDRFESWVFPWLDVPALVRSSPGTYRFPMVDRDPVERWSFGRTTLLGDAAHPMYPIGSNGASQAILDARVLTACLRCHADDAVKALERYDEERRPATGAIVLANRGFGPELPMKLVEERAPDGFADIADVITPDEIAEATDGYRRTAGFALAALADGVSLADREY
jgi:5-methylphenazine-1-carboxylate 1-monooxygenase